MTTPPLRDRADLLLSRVRWWWAGDRLKRFAIVETAVMGGAAVRNLAVWLIPVAFVQALTQDSSRRLVEFGGLGLSITWAVCIIIGAALVWAGHPIKDLEVKMLLELVGTALLALAITAYAVALAVKGNVTGSLFIFALCGASTSNLGGRAWMLTRRLLISEKAAGAARQAGGCGGGTDGNTS